MYVRRSTAAQYVATKVATKVTTKYPFQLPAASTGFFEGTREIRVSIVAIRLRSLVPQLSVNETVYLEKVAPVFRG